MILHISNGVAIRGRDVIGVFDMDTSTVNRATRDFLSKNEREGNVTETGNDLPRSFIVTDGTVYISPLNTSTIAKHTG